MGVHDFLRPRFLAIVAFVPEGLAMAHPASGSCTTTSNCPAANKQLDSYCRETPRLSDLDLDVDLDLDLDLDVVADPADTHAPT